MPRVKDMFPSNFLKAADVEEAGGKMVLTVSDITEEEYRDKSTGFALSFEEVKQKLGLNKTNAILMSTITGSDDTDNWIGFKIELHTVPTELGQGIRVRAVTTDVEVI